MVDKKTPPPGKVGGASQKVFSLAANSFEDSARTQNSQQPFDADRDFTSLGVAAEVVIARLAARCRISLAHARVAAELGGLIREVA